MSTATASKRTEGTRNSERKSDDTLLTKRDLAERFDVTVRMIELMVKGGRLPKPFYLGDSSPRWRKIDIDTWLEKLASEAQQQSGKP